MKYHIVYKDKPEDLYSKGEYFEALNPVGAILKFDVKHIGKTFIAMYIEEAMHPLEKSHNTTSNLDDIKEAKRMSEARKKNKELEDIWVESGCP